MIARGQARARILFSFEETWFHFPAQAFSFFYLEEREREEELSTKQMSTYFPLPVLSCPDGGPVGFRSGAKKKSERIRIFSLCFSRCSFVT